MTDERDTSETDSAADSRRSFLKKGAVASGALALGGAAAGTGAAQQTGTETETPTGTETETTTDGQQEDGDEVLMLYPEAVPNTQVSLESGQIDWAPFDTTGFTTYMVNYDFSPSHYAHVFVPNGTSVSEGASGQIGTITEIVQDPSQDDGQQQTTTQQDGGVDAGADGPLFVRVSFSQEDGAGTETTTDGAGTETETETGTGTGTGTENGTTTTNGGGGLF